MPVKQASEREFRPTYRVVQADERRVVLRSRRPPGSLRCCGPVAIALAMVAGFALFFIMQGYETPGVRSHYQCLPLAIGLVALILTVINLLELVQREEVLFDGARNVVQRRESYVPGVLFISRWKVPFSRIQGIRFQRIRGGVTPVWGVYLMLFDEQQIRIDRSSDHDKMSALANYLADFLRVEIIG